MDWQSIFDQIITRAASDVVLDVVVVVLLFALVRTVLLSRHITLLTRGGSGTSLESAINSISERMDKLDEHAKKSELAYNNLDARLQSAVRTVAVERFDPFQNAGGQQSFATALLNESGDGVVLSGIHARDGVRVYAKEVTQFASQHELSDEERAIIVKAQKKLDA